MPSDVDSLLKAIKPKLAKWVSGEAATLLTGGGAIQVDHGALNGLTDDDHPQYVHTGSARTITAQHSFAPTSTQAPFTLGANAQGELVTGLNADFLDSYDSGDFAVTAGDGLTGGGSVAGGTTIDVGVTGLGLSTDASNVILTSSSNPGAAASILASSASGYLTLVRLGIGGSPTGFDIYGYKPTSPFTAYLSSDNDDVTLTLSPASTKAGILRFAEGGSNRWDIKRDTDDNLVIYEYGGASSDAIEFTYGGGLDILRQTDIINTSTPQLKVSYDGTYYTNLSTDGSGNLTILPTGHDLIFAYDVSNKTTFTVSSAGTLTVSPDANFIFDTGSAQINPNTNYWENLGQLSKKYLTLHAAELWVETLVAQETIATIGGRILVGPTTKFTASPPAGTTNEIENHSFETAGGGGADVFANWTEVASDGTITQSGTALDGSYSCELIAGASTNTEVYQDQASGVSAGQKWVLMFWSRNYGSDALPRYYIYDNTNAAYIVSNTTTNNTVGDVAWRQNVVNFTIPALCTSIRVGFLCPDTNGDRGYIDYVIMHMGTQIATEHNQMSPGDVAYSEADGNVEFWWIIDGPSGTGPYNYQVLRDLDRTGTSVWYAGDALFNTGAADDGFIDLYSYSGVKSGTVGPTIVGNIRQTEQYNDWKEHWAIGNLNGLYGYGADTYGSAFGEYVSGQPFISVDSSNGLRINRYTTNLAQWDTSGNIRVGQATADHVYITSSAFQIKDNTIVRGEWQTDGDIFIGSNISAPGTTYLSIFAIQQTYNTETMYAGDMLIGDNTASKANILWDKSAGQLLFRGGQTKQLWIDTDGTLTAGGGAVKLNSAGLALDVGSGSAYQIRWVDSGATKAYINSSGVGYFVINVTGSATSKILLSATLNSGFIELDDFNNMVSLAPGGGSVFTVTTAGASVIGKLNVNTGLRVGDLTTPTDNDIRATDDIAAGGGVYAGGVTGEPATGCFIGTQDVRVGGGIVAGSSSLDPAAGDVLYTAQLTSYKNSTSYTVYAAGYYTTDYKSIWTGANRSATTYGITGSSYGIPVGAKAVLIRIVAQWSSVSSSYYITVRGDSTYGSPLTLRPQAANTYNEAYGWVPCDGSGNWDVLVAGTTANNVYMDCYGYAI